MVLTVLSYNIQEGGGDCLPAIAAAVRASRPDTERLAMAWART